MYKTIALTLIFWFLNSCSSNQKIVSEKSLLSIEEKSIEEWVGGKENSASGYILTLLLAENKQNLVFRSIFYQGQETPVKIRTIERTGKLEIAAKFYRNTKTSQIKDKSDFYNKNYNLKNNEALLSFTNTTNNLVELIKIENIKKKPVKYFMSKEQK